jgi:ATP-binding cassette subfamily C (CFTR/MRP) protein 4
MHFDYPMCCVQAVLFIHFVWVSPLMLIGYIALLWRQLGVSCLAGFAVMIVLTFVQAYLGQRMVKCRREIAVAADKRLGAMSEVLNGVRVIKMYAWEAAFAQMVGQLRRYVGTRTCTHKRTV